MIVVSTVVIRLVITKLAIRMVYPSSAWTIRSRGPHEGGGGQPLIPEGEMIADFKEERGMGRRRTFGRDRGYVSKGI
jgi:hypothetical protein